MHELIDYTLYLATDRGMLPPGMPLDEAVAEAVRNGVTVVQVREKHADSQDFYRIAREVHRVCRAHGVPLIVNDRIDIMLAVDAEGVHVGRRDIPLAAARRLCRGRILGYSVNSLVDLRHAEAAGADYVGVGPAFATSTKSDTCPCLGVEGVRGLVAAADIPCVAIGGITAANAGSMAATGVAGIAAISAILGTPDIGAAARELRNAFEAPRPR